MANDVKDEFAFGRRKNGNAVKSYLEFFKLNLLYQALLLLNVVGLDRAGFLTVDLKKTTTTTTTTVYSIVK